MLSHISIKNFATIENTEVDFDGGLNIITGETGAGKSIVIEAISLALGSRADTSLIRTGHDKAVVQLLAYDENDDEKEYIITRELSSQGKNICKINGEIVTLSELNKLSSGLADIHGQYDNQSLLDPDNHIRLLDQYKKESSVEIKQEVKENYQRYVELRHKLQQLINSERENARQKDFMKFEIQEIDNAHLIPDEDKELEDRISILQNSGKIYESLEESYQIVASEENSVIDLLGQSMRSIESISSFSKEFESLSSEISDCYFKLQDVCEAIRNAKDGIVFSPSELDTSISRLNRIEELKNKYGNSIEEILDYRNSIAEKLDLIENFSEERSTLEEKLSLYKKDFISSCQKLTQVRQAVAKILESKIQRELTDLNFQNARINICVSQAETATENGMDKVEILISTNKGEDLKPLYKVASGGELSRIMLAFKNVISSYDMMPTLIFDEIDNGISGVTASIVGKKLGEIAKSHQIICITHLPQIAACGEHNYRIYKQTDDAHTFTNVEKLDEDGKINDIARLLGGTTITETTLESAKELIEASSK